jgi:hypothetical protein
MITLRAFLSLYIYSIICQSWNVVAIAIINNAFQNEDITYIGTYTHSILLSCFIILIMLTLLSASLMHFVAIVLMIL